LINNILLPPPTGAGYKERKGNEMDVNKKYDRFSKFYDRFERLRETKWQRKRRSMVFKMIPPGSNILEVGVGTGRNFAYYPDDITVTAIDFSHGMLSKASKKVKNYPEKKINLLHMDVTNLSFSDNSFDFVVSTFVFCTVPDPIAGFKEIKRVLNPKGKTIFLEHMRSGKWYRNIPLYMMSAVSSPLFGTSMVRKTNENIQKAGLHIIEEKHLLMDIIRILVCTK